MRAQADACFVELMGRAARREHLVRSARPSAGLEDVIKCSGLTRSTAFRVLRRLVSLSWLQHGPDGFRLGSRLRELRWTTPTPGLLPPGC
jgi:DNA-binding IclR family transcriptional regulator